MVCDYGVDNDVGVIEVGQGAAGRMEAMLVCDVCWEVANVEVEVIMSDWGTGVFRDLNLRVHLIYTNGPFKLKKK